MSMCVYIYSLPWVHTNSNLIPSNSNLTLFPFHCLWIPPQTARNLALIILRTYTHFLSISTLLNEPNPSTPTTSTPLTLSALSPWTLHTPLSLPLCDTPFPHCPTSYLQLQCILPLPLTSRSPSLSPLPPETPLSLSRRGRKGRWERKESASLMPVYWGMHLGNPICLSQHLHLYWMNKYVVSVHLLPFTLSTLPTPL